MPAVLAMLDDADGAVRAAAARSLGTLAGKAGLDSAGSSPRCGKRRQTPTRWCRRRGGGVESVRGTMIIIAIYKLFYIYMLCDIVHCIDDHLSSWIIVTNRAKHLIQHIFPLYGIPHSMEGDSVIKYESSVNKASISFEFAACDNSKIVLYK